MTNEAYKHLFESAISVLAAIDRELGLPDDGCNATALTIAEVQRLKKLAAMTDTKAGELLSCIEEWAERLANCKAATRLPLPAHIHVEGQNSTISLTLMEMCAVLKNNGRDTPLGEDV